MHDRPSITTLDVALEVSHRLRDELEVLQLLAAAIASAVGVRSGLVEENPHPISVSGDELEELIAVLDDASAYAEETAHHLSDSLDHLRGSR